MDVTAFVTFEPARPHGARLTFQPHLARDKTRRRLLRVNVSVRGDRIEPSSWLRPSRVPTTPSTPTPAHTASHAATVRPTVIRHGVYRDHSHCNGHRLSRSVAIAVSRPPALGRLHSHNEPARRRGRSRRRCGEDGSHGCHILVSVRLSPSLPCSVSFIRKKPPRVAAAAKSVLLAAISSKEPDHRVVLSPAAPPLNGPEKHVYSCNCDEEVLDVTTCHTLFKDQARYLVDRCSPELYEQVLDEGNENCMMIVEHIITGARPDGL